LLKRNPKTVPVSPVADPGNDHLSEDVGRARHFREAASPDKWANSKPASQDDSRDRVVPVVSKDRQTVAMAEGSMGRVGQAVVPADSTAGEAQVDSVPVDRVDFAAKAR
jgi:hypothetical protein